MKETYKVFKLRDKMRKAPPVAEITKFFNGEKHGLNEAHINELKDVVEREYKMLRRF